MALERIILNIIPAGDMPVFHCSQYENGRSVIIDLVSSDDDAYIVPEGVTVELHCRKCDDTIVTMEPDEVDNNTVTFVTSEQLTACPGDNFCELVLYSNTEPVQTIGTLNFILHVEPDPLAGGLTSESEIYNLTQQIEDIAQEVIGNDYYNKTEVDTLLSGKADSNSVYTKAETDTLLSAKANTADLATVATTGDYDDLLNKPTIPDAQIQSDWEQADNTKVDYIKNKPDIDAMIAAALLAVMPVGTESGPIASFNTEIAAPMVNVSCDIVATGGNGTPDNPNPISGYTEANITRCGVNFFDKSTVTSGRIINGGGNDVSFTGWNVSDYIPVVEGAEFYLYGLTTHPNTNQDNFIFFDGSKTKIGFANVKTWEYPLTIPSGAKFVKCTCSGTDLNTAQFSPTNNAPYAPYNGQTYTVNFGQTVYGGVLDVTRGKLKPCIEYPSYNGETLSGRWLSSEATYIEGTTPPTGSQVVSLEDYGSDIDLTPEVISAVVGTNNVYSDTNGDTTVQFKDSIQHYIDSRV